MSISRNLSLLADAIDSNGLVTSAGLVASTTSVAGSMSAADKTKLDGIAAPSTSGNVLTSNGTAWTSVAPAAAGGFVAGTRMSFQQTAAPTGWTKDVTAALDNSSMRIVIGSVVNGGSVAFTTAFASQAVSGTNGASGATTLSTAQIPSHSHTYTAPNSYTLSWQPYNCQTYSPYDFVGAATNAAGGGGSHTHPAASFTGTAINLAVKYYDFIIASKN